jgi:bifunctional NMN adenylyltransferase/nudix hydrolase
MGVKMHEFDTAVMVGRFAPWRKADRRVLEHLLDQAARVVIVIGSAGEPRSVQTPWPADEREAMIRADIGEDGRISLVAVEDYLYRPQLWRDSVRHHAGQGRICVTGAPGEFRDWPEIGADTDDPSGHDLREAWLRGGAEVVARAVSEVVFQRLRAITAAPDWPVLRREFDAAQAYKQSWSKAPYAPVFSTVDAIIVHTCEDGVKRLLLIRRGGDFGNSLYALPGGFVDPGETLMRAAIRELGEETGLKLGVWEARDRRVRQHVFDYPYRSERGRAISHGFRFDLDGALPRVEGSDDAQAAEWVPVDQVWGLRRRMFEDHFSIIDFMLQEMR